MLLRLLALLCLFAAPAFAQTRPNVVLILVDDMSMNLMPRVIDGRQAMPALRAMQREGMTLDNFFTVNSLCCPSRAAILTGRLPHHSKVETNVTPRGGLGAFTANGNDALTFAPLMQAAGYDTAFMGKYLNGWSINSATPSGWNYWLSSKEAYDGYGYTMRADGVISTPPEYFTDKIAELARLWITTQRAPFLLHLSTFAPHGPYIPPTRYEQSFLTATMPQTPAFGARPDANAPAWLQAIPPLMPINTTNFNRAYMMRVQSLEAVDDMINIVRARVRNLGLADNTYVIFTGDNGFHMGEMSLRPGKMTPFDFDARVPFVIVGPGIAPGSRSSELVSSIDIFPTLMEWAGLPPSHDVDGRSMVPVFAGGTNGRTMAVIEHVQQEPDPADPDYPEPRAGDPPDYTALRLRGALYVEYETGEVGYYTDPHQLANTEALLTPDERARLHDAVAAVRGCAGATCQAAQER